MSLQCRVKLLDGSDFLLDLEKKEVGKFVFDQVLRRLSLPEKDKDYFGMEYEDDQKVPQWLDLSKQVKKQMKKPPFTLLFKVKFYPLDPVPHPASRTHFYRQFRRDLIDGKMKCPTHNVSDVVACILQADMGDFESTDQDIEFMTDQRLLIDQSLSNAAVQDEVATLHKLHKGKTPQEAVKTFLRKIRELETYGIKQYDVKHDDSACQLGLSPQGVSLFRRNRRIFVYDWMMVSQISFKAKKFIVMIEKEIGGEMQLVFELDSMKSSKELWSTSRGYAEFYTEPRRRIQEEPDPQTNVRSPGAQGTTTGDHFNFPPPPQPSELNQKDTSKVVDPAQKVKSLPRYLPTSKDPVANALRLNRHKKARSTSPEDATNTSNSTSEAPTSPTDDGRPSRPTEYDRQDQFQYPNSHHHQQYQQHQQQQQQSHDPNQWSHGQVDEAPLQHYDSLKCRDDYLAHQVQVQQQNLIQQQQQQMHGEINAHLAPPPPPSAPRSTTSDLNPAQASRSHSTINPEDLSSQDQDMAGSLLDLADELGEAESPTTGQNRRMVEEHSGIATISSTAAQQAMDRNGRFMQESPRTADRQVGYHSYTLPHSFSGGGHTGGGGRSPRTRNDGGGGGGSDGDSGPPKPPRTDYPPKGGEHHSGSGEMQGNSPFLPGSSFTTGRQHQKKRNLVRNWVQDQQLRTYQSSSSQESGSPANMRHLQQSSPDIRATGGQQNGRLSARSSLGSMGRSPGTSPSHLRSHDTRNRSSDSSPAHRRQSVPSASGHQTAQFNTGLPSTRSHSHSPNQQHAGVSSSIPPPAHQNDVKSDTSPPQEPYRQRMSETVNQMQSDPQVPMLIQEIDELMGGLLDSPVAERKERPSATQNAATSSAFNMLEHSPSTGMNGAGLEQGGGLIASESPFLSNINPADFLRDEEIRIDPRNYLNTPSPEPNLLGTTASTEMAASGGVSTGAFQPSPLVSGVLSTKLQQAMDEEADYHDPPPPPPHLMALTQGFKGDDRLSASRGKKQPPTVSPKPKPQSSVVSSTNTCVPQQAESSKTEQKKRPSKEPISQYDPSNLPPEIARFVNRVRHSYDGSDPTQEAQHGRQPSGEMAGARNELPTDRPVDKSAETHVKVSPTYDIPRSSVSPTFDALKVEVSASSDGQIPASVERVTITPEEPRHNTNLSTPQRQNGRPSSAEISPTTGSYSTSAAVYPEAYSPSAGSIKEQDHHSRSTEADSGIGGSAGSGGQQLHVSSGPGGPGTSTSAGGMYSYAHYRQSSQDKRDQAMQQQQLHSQQQNKEQQLPPQKGGQDQQMSWDGETQRAKHDVIQAHPQKYQQQQQQQQQQVPHQQYQLRSQPAKNASASLPRGQTLGYGAGPPPQDRLNRESSDGSSSTTPHAHSDLAIPRTQPRSPTGPAPDSLGYKYQPYTGQQSSNPPRPTRGYYPPQPPQQQKGYYPPPPQDIRRAQTFSMGQGQPRPTRMAQYRQHPGGEDSLPNSPTYFAQNPPRPNDRGALSPNAMANNRSFQEHLDTLNSTRHGRKMRVLDWMQKQQQQVDGHHMVKDPSAEVPTEPYHKQSHIYASAAEPDPPPPVNVPNPAEQRRPGSAQGGYYQQPQERGRLNTFPYSHSAAHSHPQRPPQQAPQGMAQRAQVDSRGRGYTNVPPYRPPPTGTHTAPYPQPQPPMGSGGNVGRMAGTPANAQNLPTAKFEKDYYILDV